MTLPPASSSYYPVNDERNNKLAERYRELAGREKNVIFGGEGLFDTVVTGPGKVHLQTMTIGRLARQIIPYIPNKK